MKITVIGGGPGGLYAAILIKKQWPQHDITVYERNGPNDTFGFGVVFSDETLGFLDDYDNPTYEAIRRSFAYWDDVDVHFKGRVIRCGGNGFCGCSRLTLLQILQERCEELGVKIHYHHEIKDLAPFTDSDLIIAADGLNSFVREKYQDSFQPEVDLRQNYFSWLGSSKELDAFKYFFRDTEHGMLVAHCYQYEPGRSTWVIEVPPQTWEGLGFGHMSEAEYAKKLEQIFADELEGHPLITNRSLWRQFPTIRNKNWVKDNIVLIGDSQHTAHFSIGSGTKLAMESAIALFEALKANPTVPAALEAFERERRNEVEIVQYSADVSLAWFENMPRYASMDLEQFAFGLMSRSKKITYDNLTLRDKEFVTQCNRWYAQQVRQQGFEVADDTPPMFTPFQLRSMVLANRVVVSPMAQYMAQDGLPTDWHLMHYGSRAVGGAGLVYIEMTCPSPEARITPGCLGLWSEEQRDAFKRLVEFAHTHSVAKMCLQLGHAGRKASTQLGWEQMDHPLPEGNWPIYSASPIPYLEESQVPIQMSRADMDKVVEDFVRSTRYADEAGFDMVELHMAHGYLFGSFISPLTNQRTDEYGGPIENRIRFPLEVFSAMRAAWPEHKPMAVRISATDWAPGGLSSEDLNSLARALKAAGVDLIDCSAGQTVADQKPIYGRMFQTPFADQVRHEAGIPTMAVGNITSADQVNTILISGRSDLVALARPHLTNPHFTLQAAAWYGYEQQFWAKPYLSGEFQAKRLAEREREELDELKIAHKPRSHEVKTEEAAAQKARTHTASLA